VSVGHEVTGSTRIGEENWMSLGERKMVLVRVHGRVQGVAYRAWTVYEAMDRGLDGWVRNRMDGTVEAVVAGLSSEVDRMIDACRNGPPAARVTHVEVDIVASVVPAVEQGSGFDQIATE
jgi:acylphosphatase